MKWDVEVEYMCGRANSRYDARRGMQDSWWLAEHVGVAACGRVHLTSIWRTARMYAREKN